MCMSKSIDKITKENAFIQPLFDDEKSFSFFHGELRKSDFFMIIATIKLPVEKMRHLSLNSHHQSMF